GELRNWQTQQMNDGYRTLADVPASRVNGESVNVHRFRLAVYAATRALILERVRDVDTTEQGDRKADALEAQTGDLWRDVRWAIADIQGAPRIFARLC
ncbi:head completion/stabilization protein, partial [Escherichia coli]|nr:head completion/stabilization protein [Escherichia coli]